MFETYDDILNIEELAEAMKISKTQCYKLVNSGSIKAYKEGKDWKIPKRALIEYIAIQCSL